LKHLSHIRPSGVIAFIALFVAMSGIAVADNDGKIKDNGTINIGKGDVEGSELHANSVGFAKLKEKVEDAIKDGGGNTGGGNTGGGAGGGAGGASNTTVNGFNHRVDGPSDNTVILTGNGFKLRASAEAGTCALFLDATTDNLAFTQIGHEVNGSPSGGSSLIIDPGSTPTHLNELHDGDFDIAEPDVDLLPDGAEQVLGTLNVRPLNGAVNTVNYAVDEGEQGFDCNITGTAVTAG
jgi:hypothetical protein